MKHNPIFVSFVVAMLFFVPVASNAQTTDTQSAVINLLEQIVAKQDQVIQLFQDEVAQLSAEITSLRAQLNAARSQSHICPIVDPTACSTTLTMTRDSYNCVTGYSCAPAAPAH